MADPILYYMRDNHTFRKLPNEVDAAMFAVMEEFLDGCTHGSLCSKSPGMPGMLHSRGDWRAFKDAARQWLGAALGVQPTGPDSYDAIWNALQRIDAAAAMLPTYAVKHEGGIEAFTQNIVDAITAHGAKGLKS